MFLEKKKWVIQKESSFSSSFLTENTVSSSLHLTPSSESSNQSYHFDYPSNIDMKQPSQSFSTELTDRHIFPFNQNQKIQLTITRINSLSNEQTETILVNATDCPASLCYDVGASCCVDSDSSTTKPLNSIISPSQFKVIFNDKILSPALSFAFQGIKDGSRLYIIRNDNQSSSCERNSINNSKMMHMNQFIRNSFFVKSKRENTIDHLRKRFEKQWGDKFRDSDSVFEHIKDSIDPVTSGESARISDIKRLRAEENNALYQKVCQRFQRIEANSININGKMPKSFTPTIIPQKRLEPSTCPLPGLELKQHSLMANNFMMLNDTSASSCRDGVFPDELFGKF